MKPVSDIRKDDWSTTGSSLLNAPLVPPTAEEDRLVRQAIARNASSPEEELMFLNQLLDYAA